LYYSSLSKGRLGGVGSLQFPLSQRGLGGFPKLFHNATPSNSPLQRGREKAVMQTSNSLP